MTSSLSTPTSAFKSLAWLTIACVLSWAIGAPFRQKINPGGPFISITADVFPIVVCLATIVVGLVRFRQMTARERLSSLLLLLLPTLLMAFVLDEVIRFWLWPHARGAMFGP